MIAQNIDIALNYLIERRTRAYGRLKKICCNINRQARARYIHELSGLGFFERQGTIRASKSK